MVARVRLRRLTLPSSRTDSQDGAAPLTRRKVQRSGDLVLGTVPILMPGLMPRVQLTRYRTLKAAITGGD